MVDFLALYRGSKASNAEMVGVIADPAVVRSVAQTLLDRSGEPSGDPILDGMRRARCRALQAIVSKVGRAARAAGGAREGAQGDEAEMSWATKPVKAKRPQRPSKPLSLKLLDEVRAERQWLAEQRAAAEAEVAAVKAKMPPRTRPVAERLRDALVPLKR